MIKNSDTVVFVLNIEWPEGEVTEEVVVERLRTLLLASSTVTSVSTFVED